MLDNKKLETLYSQVDTLKGNIFNWQKEVRAEGSGIVSFYMDKYEYYLKPANLDVVTAADFRNIINGKVPELPETIRSKRALYRSVKPGKWYAMFVVPQKDWKVNLHQSCTIRLEEAMAYTFEATVTKITEDGGNVFVQIEIQEGSENVMDIRTSKADISSQADGLLVPLSAIEIRGSEQCVRVKDAQGGRLVPIVVLAQDNYNALIRPKSDGALTVNTPVYVK